MAPLIHILRHGEAHHNTHANHPYRDPPLTKAGHYTTKHKHLPFDPDLILISPLTRTIQTALNMFPFLSSQPSPVPAHIWPSLRETHTTMRRGVGEYEEESEGEAVARAERVRRRVMELVEEGGYENVVLVTHSGFKGYLVKGRRFGLAEVRTYRVASQEAEEEEEGVRWGVDFETGVERDYGPTVWVGKR
ncbi:hypothetical protein COCMIDRAFT_35401 [Bipolaris oryzae ATCC 44560]|uniref:Phosphoglycerate mutase-like protein n=1 Tax=Bipolaris oryzae ATCC 44560 TaxID=930090 RepID=W6ZHS5_COCMI|nr:uncharacterized protein COCMIDRAFT_35401 [Bipolaris oryzae ATCC 44560]EUC46959.1 hypothetical protein COCMIDRAFT_35401 [Bipolaris oryzae ATCC 44560]